MPLLHPEEIVKKILEARGVSSEEGIREFLSLKPQLAHDPLLLPGAGEGADFLIDSMSLGEHICVYGDYDVDGICGTALLVLMLREAAGILGSSSKIAYHIPSRIEEGYGLNNASILSIRKGGADLIVTVDCGSVSSEEAAYAKEIGLKILITDHHDPSPGNLPDCIHVNPKLEARPKDYPFKYLSGAGVAFKLCGALVKRMGNEALHAKLRECIDLVCVATVADVMPLIDENRTFVKYGLFMLWKGARAAFRELIAVAEIDPAKLDARDIAFGVSPRLNALGRLGSASECVEFFLTDDGQRIKEIAKLMNECNQERRRIQDEVLSECMVLYEKDLDSEGKSNHPFLLLRPENSHEGVAGIVAGRVREETGLPCAVLSETQDDKEKLKGSARSCGKLDIITLLRRHSGLFERLGGHAAAAGFLIPAANEELLREALSDDLAGMLAADPALLDESKEPEIEIGLPDVTTGLADAIERLAPFGSGNPRPALSLLVNAESISDVRMMGQGMKHLRFLSGGVTFVFFGGAGAAFPEAGAVRVSGCPGIDEWNGRRRIQFVVTDINM